MAFATEFVMGAGGGPGTEVATHAQIVSPSSSAIQVGEPYVVDEAGVYSVGALGNLTNAPSSGNVILQLLVNGAMVGSSGAQANTASLSCFLPRYLEAGDTVTAMVSGSGLFSTVLYEPTVVVAPIDTVGDGTAHTGGPIELARNEWTTLASHTVARSGVVLVDHAVSVAEVSNAQSRVTVNGQERIGNPFRAVNDRWHRALSVNAGDVVEAQAYHATFSASSRVVNSWTTSFH